MLFCFYLSSFLIVYKDNWSRYLGSIIFSKYIRISKIIIFFCKRTYNVENILSITSTPKKK